jgi:N-acetyl-anhydromuramyl-L-alanine amidase AmpD
MTGGISSLDGTFVSEDSKTKHHKLAAPRGDAEIKYILLTHTAGTGDVAEAQKKMFLYGTSAHYLISKEGQITQAFPHDIIMTYTAGKSYFNGDTSLNKNSISIMMGNAGWPEQGDLYSEQQIITLKNLLNALQEEYPQARVLELSEVATDRHIAMGNFFPRAELEKQVELPTNISFEVKIKAGDSSEEVANLQRKLSQFGYGHNGAPLEITGVYDEATLKVADIFHKVHVPYTNFNLVTPEGSTEPFFIPDNKEALMIKTDEAGVNPATPHGWSDADEFVLNSLLGIDNNNEL